MEDDLKRNGRLPKKNGNRRQPQYFVKTRMTNSMKGRRPQTKMKDNLKQKMEDGLKKLKNGRRPQFFFKWNTTSKNIWKMNHLTKINQIGCDTIVN
jgi:hypothetical protein